MFYVELSSCLFLIIILDFLPKIELTVFQLVNRDKRYFWCTHIINECLKKEGIFAVKLRTKIPSFPTDSRWINGHINNEKLIGEKPVVVYFWSVSCSLCGGAYNYIKQWKGKYGETFQLVGIHMPRSKEDLQEKRIKEAIKKGQMEDYIYLDHELIVTKQFQNRIVPSFYLFDKKGLLRHIQSGETGMMMLEKRLLMLMNENK
ncbi:redoxin domain-containing protein [Psychrobacillus psychrodurans]|uniref:TlpA family protein disulfide reductase n=1 Tax=Psychrobacillus TaxID=1221880 RepID=UPI0008F219E4|nr:redoxin domain-containing protein [Psychrobacillus psychrodurans]MCK1996329.1 redoxin domain-containing protein [Psychrobacillus psychrodurans]MCZ8539371.1 redoxin domain-containing protein [Psychrobacillus psychrodurans]SFM37451.1 Thiol-disulfide isomerase or thioredoxin [Psychrobacillus psychrodurans]